jgi:hypothetical protein
MTTSSFLKRHPALESLELRHTNIVEQPGPSSIPLSNLKCLGAPSRIMNAFMPGLSVQSVNISWSPMEVGDSLPEIALRNFAPSAATARDFTSVSMRLHPDLFRALHCVLPAILIIRVMVFSASPTVSTIQSYLF